MTSHFYLNERRLKKVEKLVTNLHDKNEYVIHIRNLKEVLNHRLILKKFNRVIKFNQENWLKTYIKMNVELRRKAKINLRQILSS